MNRPYIPSVVAAACLLTLLFFAACKKQPKAQPHHDYTFSLSGTYFYPGDPVKFTSSAPAGSSLTWDFGDGHTSTDNSPVNVYSTSGHFRVTMIVNGYDTFRNELYILPPVVTTHVDPFSYRASPLVCAGVPVYFTCANSNITDILWNFGDGDTSVDVNPVHTFTANGTFSVSMTINGNSATKAVRSVSVALYPKLPSILLGSKSWHHNYYGYFSDGHMDVYTTYDDAVLSIDNVDDFHLRVGGVDLTYIGSNGDNRLSFTRDARRLDIDLSTHAISYKNYTYQNTKYLMYYCDNYYTP